MFDLRLLIWPFFLIAQGTLPWQPILGSKSAKSAYSPSFIALAFQNRVEYRNSDFERLCKGSRWNSIQSLGNTDLLVASESKLGLLFVSCSKMSHANRRRRTAAILRKLHINRFTNFDDLLRSRWYCCPFKWSNPPKPHFGGVNRRFKPNVRTI